jgi:hypothetical protein
MPGQSGNLKALPTIRNAAQRGGPLGGQLVAGTLAAIDSAGAVWILRSQISLSPVQASTIVDIDPADIGAEVLLALPAEDGSRPIILGVVRDRCSREAPTAELGLDRDRVDAYYLDRQKIEIAAEREIVLRCGESSVTLRKDGKIIIKGVHVISRAKGANKIRGAAVTIN